ncbi:MAG: SCO family protein [Silvibacterium sp.]|nr:SCO family protein [Silvibacterium sp.]
MKRFPPSLPASLLLCLLIVFPGCRRSATQARNQAEKTYHIRGVVVAIDPAKGAVTLDTDAIPGYMDAMIMPYTLKNPGIIGELHTGDTITADLFTSDSANAIDNIVVVGQAKADYKPPVAYKPLNPGDPVPDFKLLNQNDKPIHIAQFRGKVLLVTFIYTRCPLADYCPRMSHNFASLDHLLASDFDLYSKTHLLSISFDPTYDTPAVLRSYGGSYTGRYTREDFTHWDFAAPSEKELPDLLHFFLVGATPEKDRTITHSLSTIVIDQQGKVYKWYPTNDWTPEQLLADVKQLLQQSHEGKSKA